MKTKKSKEYEKGFVDGYKQRLCEEIEKMIYISRILNKSLPIVE